MVCSFPRNLLESYSDHLQLTRREYPRSFNATISYIRTDFFHRCTYSDSNKSPPSPSHNASSRSPYIPSIIWKDSPSLPPRRDTLSGCQKSTSFYPSCSPPLILAPFLAHMYLLKQDPEPSNGKKASLFGL